MCLISVSSEDAVNNVTKLINTWAAFDQKILELSEKKVDLLDKTLVSMRNSYYSKEDIKEIEMFKQIELNSKNPGPIDVLIRIRKQMESSNGKQIL